MMHHTDEWTNGRMDEWMDGRRNVDLDRARNCDRSPAGASCPTNNGAFKPHTHCEVNY